MHFFKKSFWSACALLLGLSSLPATAANSYGIPEKIQDGNILHCFDWTFQQIITELPNIAQAGFGAVQVSPVQGNCNNNAEWYYAYMPYDFKFRANGQGGSALLKNLCDEAEKYGIKIIVDVVANHVNQANGFHDTWWDSNGRVRWQGGINYGNRYSITHGQLGEYGDVNSEDSQVQARAKEFINELKSYGVKGIRWDAAKHIGLPSEGCAFWSTVCNDAALWHYGEILDGPGGDANKLMQEYTKYMSVTDNGYCNGVRNAVNSGNVPSNHAGWAAGTIAADKVVYWAESHDDYSNEWKASTNISQAVIDRTWAIVACRNGSSSLYFSRPSATERNQIKMGQKGSTHFTSKEIAAVNHLRNAAVGKEDYFTSSNGVVSVTRKGIGACIVVGNGQSRNVSVANGGGYCPAGTYKDEVSGNTFTVTASTISGQVGSTGIAVIYNGTASTEPSVTLNPAGGSFKTETLTVKATLENATSGWYKVDNGAQTAFSGTTANITIGNGVAPGKTITIYWSATGKDGTKTGSATYTKVDPSKAVYVYYDSKQTGWSNVNVYIYKPGSPATEMSAWPGAQMTRSTGTLWEYEVPESFVNGSKVIFNNGTDQYPQDEPGKECGLDLNGVSMICEGTNWKEYNGQHGGDDPVIVDPDPNSSSFIVYWKNDTQLWATPHVYYWGGSSAPSWPGTPMKSLGGNIWKADIATGSTGLIFDKGPGAGTKGVDQTEDLVPVHKHIYNMSNDLGEWAGAGVEVNVFDQAEATPEYYTLMGVRVAEPASGNIYIVRRGNKVTKEYVR